MAKSITVSWDSGAQRSFVHHSRRQAVTQQVSPLARRLDSCAHPVNLKREQAQEGKYLIQTEEQNLTAVEAVSIYKELSEVERTFANLKDVIEMRPIYHQTDRRVQAHIFVAALAFLLHRAIEKKLKAAGLDLSATEALQTLRSVRIVEFQLSKDRTSRSVTRGTARAAAVLSALGITALDPPTFEVRPAMAM